jgi:dCMP deaminase
MLTRNPPRLNSTIRVPIFTVSDAILAEMMKSAAIEDWHDYFLTIAKVVSLKSKEESRVGAVIVSPDKMVISTGYNGPPRDVFDSETLFDKDLNNENDEKTIAEKLRWICHAEQNAILNAVRLGVSVKDCTIYVNKFPCLACLNIILQAGIKHLYTHDIAFWDGDPFDGKYINEQSDEEPHWRKRELINQVDLNVIAPFHENYQYQSDRKYLSWTRIYEDFLEPNDEVKKDNERKQKLIDRDNTKNNTGSKTETTPVSPIKRASPKKQSFLSVFWLTLLLSCAVFVWLLLSTGADRLRTLMASVV